MKNLKSHRLIAGMAMLLISHFLGASTPAPAQTSVPVSTLIYSTMPSKWTDRPEMAMDGDERTSFRSYYGMEEGDTFVVIFGRPIPVRSLRISTGNASGEDILTDAIVETSSDGETYTKAAAFDKAGIADAKLANRAVLSLRIRMNRGRAASRLQIRELKVDTAMTLASARPGPPRGFIDLSEAPDLRVWADKAEKQMESFWSQTAALLYSDGFVTPNAVNVVYKTGPGVTDVAAAGGGVITVNSKWCREHPEDTGLTVHETAHIVQSGGAPGWLVEAVADYIRWVKFQPQDFKPQINLRTATSHDPYRTGATFLGWLELHYDRKLVTKLNDDARFGRYKDEVFVKYCGKDIETLWKEFTVAYQADPTTILTAPIPAAMKPRSLPPVQAGTSKPVVLAFDIDGVIADGTKFATNGGFDAGGAAYSGSLLGGRRPSSASTSRWPWTKIRFLRKAM